MRCSELAYEKGYRYIGLQFYGECWSGVHSSDLLEGPKSDNCWGYHPDFQNCDDKSSTECIGQAHYNYIYEVRPKLGKVLQCVWKIRIQISDNLLAD